MELIELADARDDGGDEDDSDGATALKFIDIARELNNGRTAKQCRDRYKNYLRGGIKKGGWTVQEDELIKDMYATFGARYVCKQFLPHACRNAPDLFLTEQFTCLLF
jgi:Myb-like DNA-binding domain